MSPREYEHEQLELITAEYAAKGYSVRRDVRFRVGDRAFLADAVATRDSTRETVIIEVVNAKGKLGSLGRRAELLSDLARQFESTRVDHDYPVRLDLRYIERRGLARERAVVGASLQWRTAKLDLQDLLAMRLRRPLNRGDRGRSFASEYL